MKEISAEEVQAKITGIIEDPWYENENYAVGIFSLFEITLGHGIYFVINKSTRIVEASGPSLPGAVDVANNLNEAVKGLEISNFRILSS